MKNPAGLRGFSSSGRLYLRPVGLMPALRAPEGSRPLAGGPLAFGAVEASARSSDGVLRQTVSLETLLDWARGEGQSQPIEDYLDRLSAPRPPIAGLAFDEPRLMGILNVTPDSFHDGGRYADAGAALARGRAMAESGADIIDVGGESTRPGAEAVSETVEADRVLAVIEGLKNHGLNVSIDSRRAAVVAAAIDAGAALINDVHALTGPDCLQTAANSGLPVVLMHGPETPDVMQSRTDYEAVVFDVYDWLEDRIEACEKAGIARARIIVDPGIGFAKTARQCADVLAAIAILHGLGCALMLGASRKSFIGRFSADEPSTARLPGSIAALTWGLSQGVQVHRVHDVAESRQAVTIWRAAVY
jgi:dihydropteroate synthase